MECDYTSLNHNSLVGYCNATFCVVTIKIKRHYVITFYQNYKNKKASYCMSLELEPRA
jgi:hypothetical protein